MRTIGFTLGLLLLFGSYAVAQIAAPSLNPTPTLALMPMASPISLFVPGPSNPAVLSWDGPSRVGATYGNGAITDFVIAPPGLNPAAKGKTSGLLIEGVGQTFAAAAQVNSQSLNLDASIGGGSLDTKVQRIGVAAQFGNRISIGIGSDSAESKNSQTNIDVAEAAILGGVTVRLADVIYIGAASGSAKVKDKIAMEDVSRHVLQYGIAYLRKDKGRGLHVEVFHAARPAVAYPSTNPAAAEDDINGFTVEAMFAQILLGYASQTDKTKDSAGIAVTKNSLSTVTVGFDMSPGLALVATRNIGRVTDVATGSTIFNTNSSQLGVAWQF